MFGLGMPEIMLILAIALIVIGPKKLPDLAKSLGRAMNEFKKATSEFKETMNLEYDVKSVKKTFDDVEAEIRKTSKSDAEDGKKLSAKTGSDLKKKSDPEPGSLKTKDFPAVMDEKTGESWLLPDDADDTDNDMAGTDIPAELLVNADEPASGNRMKEKGHAKDGN